ncbi:hypothetical protein CP10743SC13_0419B, partial [Chlamydia psittaci 10_743_SC13]
GGGGVVGIL